MNRDKLNRFHYAVLCLVILSCFQTNETKVTQYYIAITGLLIVAEMNRLR